MNNKLIGLLEKLIFNPANDSTPCEVGIACPFYDNENPYCSDGNCVEGMAILIEKILKTT